MTITYKDCVLYIEKSFSGVTVRIVPPLVSKVLPKRTKQFQSEEAAIEEAKRYINAAGGRRFFRKGETMSGDS